MAQETEIIKQRGYQKAALTRIGTYIDKISEVTDVVDIQLRLDHLEEVFREFCRLDSRLNADLSEIEDIESKYFECKSRLLILIKQRTAPSGSALPSLGRDDHASSGCDFRMPRLNIPSFNGDFMDWMSFKDLYVTLVHSNSSLKDIQKFQYLRGLLGEVPSAVIRHIPISESTYKEAWSRLLGLFDQKRMIVNSLITKFLSQARIERLSGGNLRCYVDTSEQIFGSLASIVPEKSICDVWLVHLLLEKVDSETQRIWAEKTVGEEFPSLQMLLTFLGERCSAMESMRGDSLRPSTCISHPEVMTDGSNDRCPKCGNRHPLARCLEFIKLNISTRRDFVRRRNLCFNCFSDKHTVRGCSSRFSCRTCKDRHHSSLHEFVRNNMLGAVSEYTVRESNGEPVGENLGCISTNAALSNIALLPTALVSARSASGGLMDLRIMLDSGSQTTFVSESAVNKLRVRPALNGHIQVSGIASSKPVTTIGTVDMYIQSKHDSSQSFNLRAYVLRRLTSAQPSGAFSFDDRRALVGLDLADPTFSSPGEIDMIVGVDHFFSLILPGQVLSSSGIPIAQNSRFGWIVLGRIDLQLTNFAVNCVDVDLQLKRFWEVESVPAQSNRDLTEEERFCEGHFRENLEMNSDGRFVVGLPFYRTHLHLGNSYGSALQRLLSMEKKFACSSSLRCEYGKFMRKYEEMEHMSIADYSGSVAHGNKFYLPHHAVFKEDSSTTKLRVVFDGSSKSDSHVSVNNILGVGPKIQRDLFEILINFRRHKVAFSADIAKMYRQILVRPSDQSFQRILWRYGPSDPVSEFKLKTVTYGLSCSSFLATRCLKQIAMEDSNSERASRVILQDFYMDDLLSGTDTIEEALEVCEKVSSLLEARGFRLRKWQCNSPELLSRLRVEVADRSLEIGGSDHCRVLGLLWNSNLDFFYFKPNLELKVPLTKRKILSQSAQVFDPLGLISPVIVWIKIFYQKLWLLKNDWDDPLPSSLSDEWFKFQRQFNEINIQVPRCVTPFHDTCSVIGFCDASTQAYAAVVYIRQQNLETTSVKLLVSKTKVSPLKQISIPKLELCSAVLLTRLLRSVTRALSLSDVPIYAWTDSKVVLAWLSSVPRRWKCFVANRTAEIQDALPRSNWNYVKSSENPADLASRGIEPELLPQNELWWNGPKFLSGDVSLWPSEQVNCEDNIPEDRGDPIFSHAVMANDTLDALFERYSSFSKIVRIISYCLRFKCKLVSSGVLRPSFCIDATEMHLSRDLVFRWIQESSFGGEMECIRGNRPLERSSRILSLNPFIDKDGLLRAGGRLRHSDLSFNSKHPVILPGGHRLSFLLVTEAHIDNLHAGPTLLASLLKQSFWIIGARKLILHVTRNCLLCFRHRARAATQLMGDLPQPRVQCSRPFTNCGVDFAGPIQVKLRRGRGGHSTKGYISLFICLAVKAAHLELVSDLSSDAFIAALRRFSSRRGAPQNVYCDNATNFVGARNKLSDLSSFIGEVNDNSEISYFLCQKEINWHMIPAASPHMGGIWEANVKSMKYHLRRVVGNSLLTFEELTTLLCEIESVLNSRPLVARNNDDIDSLDVLTPSHFLIGAPMGSIPGDESLRLNTRWDLLSSMLRGFWRQWSLEYLNSLQQRTKWRMTQPNLRPGDLVLLREPNLPPAVWPLGRVLEVYPGSDGLVRVVQIRTAKGAFRRAITKIIKLPEEPLPASN